MTQEDKELLLKDLCARLTYDVLVLNKDGDVESFTWQELKEFGDGYISKPYLRPMSSMTKEEEKEYINIDNLSYSCPMVYAHFPAFKRIDWLNAHHFDYRGLIPKGLAIEAPKGMYKNNYCLIISN